jgi:transcription elongation factor GreA
MAVSYMTKEGYDKILAEINYLETVNAQKYQPK